MANTILAGPGLNTKGMFSTLLDGSFNYNAQIVALVIMLAILNISTHFIWVTAGNHIYWQL
jgi:hypothetical protein